MYDNLRFSITEDSLMAECHDCGDSIESLGKDESSLIEIRRWVKTHEKDCTR